MILSKASLGIVELCKADKNIPVLNTVLIEPDGSVVASNGKILVCVSPVEKRICEAVPLQSKIGDVKSQIILSSDTVKEIIKSIPRDMQFKGILEHVAIKEVSEGKIELTITDGKQKKVLNVRTIAKSYLSYKKVFKDTFDNLQEESNGRVIMNRKRMNLAILALDKVCPYDGDFSPVFWQFTKNGDVLVKAINEITEQKFMAVFQSMDVHGTIDWPDFSVFERKLKGGGAFKLK